MSETFLVRYGAIPDVARFSTALNEPLPPGWGSLKSNR
jgi:hypothetical protein